MLVPYYGPDTMPGNLIYIILALQITFGGEHHYPGFTEVETEAHNLSDWGQNPNKR